MFQLMKAHTDVFVIQTNGKGTYEVTDRVARIVAKSGVVTGLATVLIQHTSASLIIYENADRSARVDLENYFNRLVPEDAGYFVHTAEGPDDMPSHIRMVRPRCRSVKQPVRGSKGGAAKVFAVAEGRAEWREL